MNVSKMFFATLASCVLFASCSKDNDTIEPLGIYENGILVVNEGNGSAGSVTYINNNLSTIQQNVYGAENANDGIGGYVQSIFFNNEKAFIISNGSNKITVVNRYTFKLIDKIETGFSVPRYGVVYNGKAYVTNLASFASLTDDFISVINLSTYEVETTIPVNAIADKIALINGKLYVSNGTYGDGNSLKVINPVTNSVVKTLTFGNSPNSMEEKNGTLYVLCSNYSSNSELVKINLSTDTILSTTVLPLSLGNAQNLNLENDKLYFTVDSKVYSENLTTTSISTTPLFTSTATTLYGFKVENNRIYTADAKDYASDGRIFVNNLSGILEREIPVGLIPNGFYFND